MGFLPIFLLVLALKIPICGLIWFAFWAAKEPEVEGPAEEVRAHKPRRPRPPLGRGPRRRGPHGGGAMHPLPECAGAGARTHAVAAEGRSATATRHAPAFD
jgi:hypothetical protein